MSTLCRLCGSENAVVHLFTPKSRSIDLLRDVITLASGVEIREDDIVSKMVCQRCCEVAVKLHRYRSNAMANDKILKAQYGIHEDHSSNGTIQNTLSLPNGHSDADNELDFSLKHIIDENARNTSEGKVVTMGSASVHKSATVESTGVHAKYIHPSIKKLVNQLPNIVIPPDIFSDHVSPVITLDESEVNDWYETQLKIMQKKLSHITFKKVSCGNRQVVQSPFIDVGHKAQSNHSSSSCSATRVLPTARKSTTMIKVKETLPTRKRSLSNSGFFEIGDFNDADFSNFLLSNSSTENKSDEPKKKTPSVTKQTNVTPSSSKIALRNVKPAESSKALGKESAPKQFPTEKRKDVERKSKPLSSKVSDNSKRTEISTIITSLVEEKREEISRQSQKKEAPAVIPRARKRTARHITTSGSSKKTVNEYTLRKKNRRHSNKDLVTDYNELMCLERVASNSSGVDASVPTNSTPEADSLFLTKAQDDKRDHSEKLPPLNDVPREIQHGVNNSHFVTVNDITHTPKREACEVEDGRVLYLLNEQKEDNFTVTCRRVAVDLNNVKDEDINFQEETFSHKDIANNSSNSIILGETCNTIVKGDLDWVDNQLYMRNQNEYFGQVYNVSDNLESLSTTGDDSPIFPSSSSIIFCEPSSTPVSLLNSPPPKLLFTEDNSDLITPQSPLMFEELSPVGIDLDKSSSTLLSAPVDPLSHNDSVSDHLIPLAHVRKNSLLFSSPTEPSSNENDTFITSSPSNLSQLPIATVHDNLLLAVDIKKCNNDKVMTCRYCDDEIPNKNFMRHLRRTHAKEKEVVDILKLPKNSSARRKAVALLRNDTNFTLYVKGVVKPNRDKKIEYIGNDEFYPCAYCKGIFRKEYLKRHAKKCVITTQQEKKNVLSLSQTAIACAMDTTNTLSQLNIKTQVFDIMKGDDIAFVAKKDILIAHFGESYLKKSKGERIVYACSNRIRELARLLIALRKILIDDELSLKEIFHPVHFDSVLAAVREIVGYDSEKQSFKSPSLATHIGSSLKLCADELMHLILKRSIGFQCKSSQELDTWVANVNNFKKLVILRWNEEVSSLASKTLQEKYWSKPALVPLVKNVKTFREEALKLAAACENKFSNETDDVFTYKLLVQCSLALLILTNRGRIGDVQYLKISDYKNDIRSKFVNVEGALSQTEKILTKKYKRVINRRKGSRVVLILIPENLKHFIDMLLRKRIKYLSRKNDYVFAIPNSGIKWGKGDVAINELSKKFKLENPIAFNNIRLRKHIATIMQILDLSTDEVKQFSSFMGHAKKTHEEFYELPLDIYQIAKISQILLLMEKGNIPIQYKGNNSAGLNLTDSELTDEETLFCDQEIRSEQKEIMEPSEI